MVSCGSDEAIIIYSKKEDKYQMDYKIKTIREVDSIVQTKENEICTVESHYNNYDIIFYDLNERKSKFIIFGINNSECVIFNMKTSDLLIVGGGNRISFVDVNNIE